MVESPDNFACPASATRVPATELIGANPILVLTPHPDDESLGCGGLLAAAFEGAGAVVVCVTDGAGSHPGSRQWSRSAISALRARELDAAIEKLGGNRQDIVRLGCPDGAMPDDHDSLAQLARQVASIGLAHGCLRVFATTSIDAHQDHKTTHALGERVVGLLAGAELYTYPVWSRWDEPGHQHFVESEQLFALDTDTWRQRKQQAIEQHRSQHGLVISDDPEGFVLPQAMVDGFIRSDELFFRVSA